jgi:hypothetical protein
MPAELLDVVDEHGNKLGYTVSKDAAHREGL